MALISEVEKRSARARLIYLGLYTLLVCGSITMVYPLMIMLSSSVSSEVDYEQYHVLPKYLWDDDLLWQKYLGLKYDREFSEFKRRYRITENVGDFRFYTGTFDRSVIGDPRLRLMVDDWQNFKRQLPLNRTDVFFTDKYRMGPTQMEYHEWLAEKFGNVQRFNLYLDPPGNYRYFNDAEYFVETMLGHNWPPFRKKERDLWLEFKKALGPELLRVLCPSHEYQEFLESRFLRVEDLNQYAGTAFKTFYQVDFLCSPPENDRMAELWLEFFRTYYPLRYVRVPGDYSNRFKSFILSLDEFAAAPELFNEVATLSADDPVSRDYFAELKWTDTMPESDFLSRLWTRFVDTLPPDGVAIYSMLEEYRSSLKKQYGTVAELNRAYGTEFEAFRQVDPPYKAADMLHFHRNRGHYRSVFFWGNYKRVVRYIFVNGFALKNTIILVVLWVFGNLTVQPMAAYALSRFNLSYANKVLLFLIATMSFPHSVTMIPNFLLLKKLHLLNTYAALILPHLVHGMGIFLLKGYFDSLPRELYEAGMIDGASELQMFFRITLPLSMPILAVIALRSFTAAYGSFMWAFLICQKESMWTLMVFLYQFKQFAPPYTHMAALVIAGIPTLIVFILAQRIIMRGIVVPTMK